MFLCNKTKIKSKNAIISTEKVTDQSILKLGWLTAMAAHANPIVVSVYFFSEHFS